MSVGVRPAGRLAGRLLRTDLSLRDIGLNFFVKLRTYVDLHLGFQFSKYAKSSRLRSIL